jgi:hypothetical protein
MEAEHSTEKKIAIFIKHCITLFNENRNEYQVYFLGVKVAGA